MILVMAIIRKGGSAGIKFILYMFIRAINGHSDRCYYHRAGTSGLMPAHTPAQACKTATVLEARERTGARIFTLQDKFSIPTEAGAECMHGKPTSYQKD